ncbi:hypothetical protein KDW_32920 [Dictyobacter vulcani]|uniref:Sec-independent protein translocase protein TatA n=1 Tax=Dictyobacter vulcani TaxID=2607529 RepID=A0A5J4KRU4_9CHLR|nr:twin-arginine translocase TatA/TatE family subunit [Dictyobacter vulcani]GER89130.1 hypothetical protein KDW_32920 [Dictyobacter vulcani]
MHLLEILIVAGIALALFGPKALQSIARNAGKTTGEVKNAKDKFMSQVPAEDISKLHQQLNKVPTNPAQAMQMFLSPDEKKAAATGEKTPASTTKARPDMPEK